MPSYGAAVPYYSGARQTEHVAHNRCEPRRNRAIWKFGEIRGQTGVTPIVVLTVARRLFQIQIAG
jgi:hypothetical protein